MADRILTPCNVARSWHWFREVTAFSSVACGSGIVTVNSPKGSTAPCNVIRGSGMTCHWIDHWPNVRHFGILHLVSISTTSPQSTCHSAPAKFYPNWTTLGRKNDVMSSFKIADFRGPIMGSLKSPGTTFYRSSIDTIALNCLVFEKIAFFASWGRTDRQTDERRIDGHHRCVKPQSRCRELRLNK